MIQIRKLLLVLCSISLAWSQTESDDQKLTREWSGVWKGTLINYPGRPNAKAVQVTREIGPLPTKPNECTTWKTTYQEAGSEKSQSKDYRLCRGETADQWVVNEGPEAKLPTRLLGNQWISVFKYDNILLTAITRLEGDRMIEEIISGPDLAAGKGVVTLQVRSLQRLELARQR
jgi:hypothetical protein